MAQLSFSEEAILSFDRLSGDRKNVPLTLGLLFDDLAFSAADVGRLIDGVLGSIDSLHRAFEVSAGGSASLVAGCAVRSSILDIDETNSADVLKLGKTDQLNWFLKKWSASNSFDLSGDKTLFSSAIYQLHNRRFIWTFACHQALLDDRSKSLLALRVFDALSTEKQLSSASVLGCDEFARFVALSRTSFDKRETALASYWAAYLREYRPIDIPLSGARPLSPPFRINTGFVERKISLDSATLDLLCATSNIKMSSFFLACFAYVLFRYSGNRDLYINTVLSMRTDSNKNEIGQYDILAPVSCDLRGSPMFDQLCRDVDDMLNNVSSYLPVPASLINDLLRRESGYSNFPVRQVLFDFEQENADLNEMIKQGKIFYGSLRSDQRAVFDISLSIKSCSDATFELSLEYNQDLLGADMMGVLLEHVEAVAVRGLAEPDAVLDDVDIRSDRQILRWKERSGYSIETELTKRAFSSFDTYTDIAEAFVERATEHPDGIAVLSPAGALSNRECLARASKVASQIVACREPESSCIILLDRSPDAVIALLAVTLAGICYTPVEADFPEDRVLLIAEDCGADILVSRSDILANFSMSAVFGSVIDVDEIPDDGIVDNQGFNLGIDPDTIAYKLYTSGSDGSPKGVIQTFRNANYHIRTWVNRLKIDQSDKLFLTAGFAWDSGFQDIFSSFLTGATLVAYDVRKHGLHQADKWISSADVTVLHMTLPLFREFAKGIHSETDLSVVRLVCVGGDTLLETDVKTFNVYFGQQATLVNAYGMTESSSALMSFFRRSDADHWHGVNLGFPPIGMDVVLLNANGEQYAVNGEGEIALRSPYLALGYLNDEGSSLATFTPINDGSGMKQIRTGDFGQLLSDGAIKYLGRRDNMIKIRGNRVSPEEIESVLSKFAPINSAMVAPVGREGEKKLVAVVTLNNKESALKDPMKEIRAYLVRKLPSFMIPDVFEFVDELPRTDTGKLDRGWVRSIVTKDSDTPTEVSGPQTPTEKAVAQCWSDILEVAVSQLDVNDSFFEIGGHSILALSLVALMIEREILAEEAVADDVMAIFEAPTIAEMAILIDQSSVREIERA